MINAMDFIFTTQYKLGIDFINNAKRPCNMFVSHERVLFGVSLFEIDNWRFQYSFNRTLKHWLAGGVDDRRSSA